MEVIVLSDSSDESETALVSAATTPAASPAVQQKPAQSVGYANAVEAALAMAAALETTENGNGRKRKELKTKKKKLAPPLLPAKFKKQQNNRRKQQIAAERRPRPAEKTRRTFSNHRYRGRSVQRSLEPPRSRTSSSSSSSGSDSSSSSSLSSSSGSRSHPRFRQEERRPPKATAGRVVQPAQRRRDPSGGNKRPNSDTKRRVTIAQQTPTKKQSSMEVVDLMSSSSSSSDSSDNSRSRSSSASSVASSAGRSLARTPVKSGKKRLVLNNRVLGKGAPRPVQFSNQHAQYADASNRVQGGDNHIRSKIAANTPGKRKRVLPQMRRGSSCGVGRQGRAPLDNRAKAGDTEKKSATNGARSQPSALSGSATASRSSPLSISSSSASSSPTSSPRAVQSQKSVSAPFNTTQTSTDAFGRYHCRKTVSTSTRPSDKRTPALSPRWSPSSSPSPRKKRRVFTYFNTDNVALNDIQAQERELAWIRLQRKQTQNRSRPPTDPVQKDNMSREVIDVDDHSDTNSAGHLENAIHSDNHRDHVKSKAKRLNNVKQTPSAVYRGALVHPTSYRGIYLDEAPSNILSIRGCKPPFESNCNQPLTFYADSDRLARQCAILESFGKPTQCISSVFPGEAAKPQSEVTRAVSTLVTAQLPIIRSCHRRKVQAILVEARQKISTYQVALKKQRRSHRSQNAVMSHRLHRSVEEKLVVRNLKTVKHLSAGSVSFQIGRGDGFVREMSVSSLIQICRVEEIRPLRKYTTSIGLRANYRVEDDPILRYTATTRPNGASGVGEVEKKYGLRMGNVADDEVVEYVLRLVVGRLGDSEQVFQALKSELDFSQAYTAYGELKKMHDSRERAVARLERVEKLRHRGVHGADSDVTAIINLMERSSLSKASRVKSLSRRLQPPTRNFESSFVDNLVDSATSGMAMLGLRATDSYEELADAYRGSFCRMCYMYACHEHGGDHPLPARRVEPAYPRVQSTPLAASGVEGVDVSAASSDDDMGYVSSGGRGNVGLAHAAARARRESGAPSATSGGGDVDMGDDDRQQRRQRKQLADPSEYVDASHVSLVAAKMHSFLSTDNSCGEQCWKSGRPVDGVKQHAAAVSAAELGVIRKLRETMGDNSCLLAAVVGSISCIYLRDLIDKEQNSNENGAADGAGRSGRRMRNWKHGRRSGGSNHELLQRTRNQRLQDRGTENHEYKPCMHEGMCDSTGCSCMKRDHMCEKACACSRDCPNRFEGCTCASGECRTNKCPCFAALRECDPDVCSSCGASDVAVVATVAGNDGRIDRCVGSSCGNVNVIRSKHMRLGMSFSSIHGYGMYAREAIAANEFVYEYTGAMLSQDEAERRGLIYDKMEMSYLFDLNEDAVLDALRNGNKSKFINHNGETPNCTAKVVSVCGVHHISIWALRDIAVGEELVFDYGYKRSVGPDWSQRRAASKDTV